MADNTVTLVGNITSDPELRFTPSGMAVASFTVAVNRRYRTPDGNWEDKLDGFFNCSCWRDLAEHVAESLTKGMRVIVTGRLNQRSWEDKEGNRRTAVEIQVDEIGPSLRFATASVTKSSRTGAQQAGGDWGGQPANGGDWGAPVAQPPSDDGGF